MVHHPPDPARFEFTQPVPDLGETIRAALTSGGGLHRCAERLGHPFEERPEQVVMAGQVLSALMGRHHLAVEAGTGVGKSLAYLPAGADAFASHLRARGDFDAHDSLAGAAVAQGRPGRRWRRWDCRATFPWCWERGEETTSVCAGCTRASKAAGR